MRREKELEKEIARHSPEREKDIYVDNDLLMYKISLWADTQNIEPQFQDSWDTLPALLADPCSSSQLVAASCPAASGPQKLFREKARLA